MYNWSGFYAGSPTAAVLDPPLLDPQPDPGCRDPAGLRMLPTTSGGTVGASSLIAGSRSLFVRAKRSRRSDFSAPMSAQSFGGLATNRTKSTPRPVTGRFAMPGTTGSAIVNCVAPRHRQQVLRPCDLRLLRPIGHLTRWWRTGAPASNTLCAELDGRASNPPTCSGHQHSNLTSVCPVPAFITRNQSILHDVDSSRARGGGETIASAGPVAPLLITGVTNKNTEAPRERGFPFFRRSHEAAMSA